MPVGDGQEHIRVDVHRIAEQAVRLVAAVFEIRFVLGVAGGVNAVPAADQDDGEALLGRNPYHALMAVDEPLLPCGELRSQQAFPAHLHELEIRAAEADHHRLDRDALLQRFPAQALPGRIDQVDLAVYQRPVRVILEISAVCFHGMPPNGRF